MPKFTFLHLSDLHYSDDNLSQSRVLAAFFKDVASLKSEQNIQPNFIIFSGDLVNAGDNYNEFKDVKSKFIDKLLYLLQLNKDSFFIAPGNHDIQKSLVNKRNETGLDKCLVNIDDIDKVIDGYDTEYKQDIKQRFSNYHKFLKEFSLRETSLTRNNVFSTYKIKIKNNSIIGIACFNSSLRATGIGGRNDYGNLIIGSKQINLALKTLEGCDYRIANLHHSFDWITEIEKHDIKRIIKREFDFILYGHNHSASVEQTVNPDNECVAINSPALYENSRTFVGYSVTQVFSSEIKIHLRSYYKDRDVFDKATDKLSNGCFVIDNLKKPSKVDDNFTPNKYPKYPLEEIKSLVIKQEKLSEEDLFYELNKLKGKPFNEIGYKASAIVSTLISKNSSALKARDISDLCLKGTDFTGADLTEANFTRSDISNTFFSDVVLDRALFDSVDLTDSQFIEIKNKRAVDFSDENQIVSGGSSGAIIYCNSKVILRGHHSSILDLRFSFCKQFLASAHDNGMIFIWQPKKSIEPIKVLRKHRNPIYTVCWNPATSSTILSNGIDGSLCIWDWQKSETTTEIKNHKKEILTLDWNHNGKFLLSSGIDRRIVILDTRDWTPVSILPIIHRDYVRSVKWKNSKYFASCGDDGMVYIWYFENAIAQHISQIKFDVPVLSLAWHPNLNILACGLRDDRVIFWDMEDMSDIKCNNIKKIKLHIGRVWDINWDNNGDYLVSAGNEGSIIIWNKIINNINNKLFTETEIINNTKIIKMNFSCHGLILRNLIGINKNGYQAFKNKDRDFDLNECSLKDWLLNHGAELE